MDFKCIVLVFSIILAGSNAGNPCVGRSFGDTSFVCVCNSTYCDTIDEFEEKDLQHDSYVHYESSMNGKRLFLTRNKFSKKKAPDFKSANFDPIWLPTTFAIDPNLKYQEIIGFGGGLTDAVGLLLGKLNDQMRQLLLRQYFGPEGLNYQLIRLTMGSSDFSWRNYTYDDNGTGTSLSTFNLTVEDYEYKIPAIKQMQKLSTSPIKVIGSPWNAPRRMTEPRYFNWAVYRKLTKSFYGPYANYFVKFLEAYKENGIPIWAVTPQNEPTNGLLAIGPIMSMGWTPTEIGIFVGQYLGPILNISGHGDIKILAFDDIWTHSYDFLQEMMPYCMKYVDGIAMHTYFGDMNPASSAILHYQYPNLSVLHTEFSIMPTTLTSVHLGQWENLETYVTNICDVLNNWVEGFLDWNMVLDEKGGPNYLGNYLDAPIIISNKSEEFFKQPIWYGLAHYAHFVPPGSKRIDVKEDNDIGMKSIAFLTPENRVVVLILNRGRVAREIVITNAGKDIELRTILPPKSLHTFIYKPNQLTNASPVNTKSLFSISFAIFLIIKYQFFS